MKQKYTAFANVEVKTIRPLYILLLSSSLFWGCSRNGQFQATSAQVISAKPTEEIHQTKSIENDIDTLSGIKDNVEDGLILPNKSIGQLNLGNTKEFAILYLGKPTEEYEYSEATSCSRKEIHWNDYKLENAGVFVYQRDNKIFYIETFTERFKTVNGIKTGDSPKKLINTYPNLKAYELMYSAAIVNGGKNIIYWVDNEQGIAFGIYYFRKKEQRRIGSIIVFDPQKEFQPDGCISPPQELVNRKKWYLN